MPILGADTLNSQCTNSILVYHDREGAEKRYNKVKMVDEPKGLDVRLVGREEMIIAEPFLKDTSFQWGIISTSRSADLIERNCDTFKLVNTMA